MTTIDAAEAIYYFAYGNDRKGLPLDFSTHDLIADSIESELGPARAPFVKLYYAGTDITDCPVAVFAGKRDIPASGEVYELRLDEKMASVLEQFVKAGYHLSDVEVELSVGGRIMAMVPTWNESHGVAVPDNDWLSPERLRTW